MKALNALGATRGHGGLPFLCLLNVVAGFANGYLQPLFGIGLERVVDERVLGSLAGYRDLGPVRSVCRHRSGATWLRVCHPHPTTQCFFDERLPDMDGVLSPTAWPAVSWWSAETATPNSRPRNGDTPPIPA